MVALTETWMTVDDDTSEYKLESNQPIGTNPRKEAERRSGGVSFYIRNDLNYTPVELLATSCAQFLKWITTKKTSN